MSGWSCARTCRHWSARFRDGWGSSRGPATSMADGATAGHVRRLAALGTVAAPAARCVVRGARCAVRGARCILGAKGSTVRSGDRLVVRPVRPLLRRSRVGRQVPAELRCREVAPGQADLVGGSPTGHGGIRGAWRGHGGVWLVSGGGTRSESTCHDYSRSWLHSQLPIRCCLAAVLVVSATSVSKARSPFTVLPECHAVAALR
jgi:hypothetical protein